MKKIASIVILLLMILPLAIPAFAALEGYPDDYVSGEYGDPSVGGYADEDGLTKQPRELIQDDGAPDESGQSEEPKQKEGTVADTLVIMGKGMLGVFSVMFILMMAVVVMNAIASAVNKKKEGESEN